MLRGFHSSLALLGRLTHEDKERRRYEEDNFVRVVVGKVRGRYNRLFVWAVNFPSGPRFSTSLSVLLFCRKRDRLLEAHWRS
jgi:hypothetical protein